MTNFYIAKNFDDVFYQIKSVPGLRLVGSCTSGDDFGDKVLSLRSIHELSLIEKREHYIDFGTAVSISQILKIGKTNQPLVLYQASETIGNPFIKNLATIGGNVMKKNTRGTLFAPLLAMDARLEIATVANPPTFISLLQIPEQKENFVVKKIRVPLEEWDIEIFKRLGPAHSLHSDSASFTLLADSQRGILTKLRIAYCGSFVFRNQDLENRLIGFKLPLSEKEINGFVDGANMVFEEDMEKLSFQVEPILKEQFLRLLKHSLLQMSV